MNKFSSLKRELKKDALYRFVPFTQNSLKSLINSTLFFSDPHYQNDPIDSNFILDITSVPDDYRGLEFRKYHKEDLVHFMVKFKIESIIKNNYGICCFSKNYNGILLWTHYADAGRGFCFIFNRKDLVESLKLENESIIIKEVNYEKIPSVIPNFINKEMIIDYLNIMASKNKPWKYENEVRIICELNKKQGKDKTRIYNYDPKSLRGIILGERMVEEEIRTIKKILLLPGFSKVMLYVKKRNYDNPLSYSFNLLK